HRTSAYECYALTMLTLSLHVLYLLLYYPIRSHPISTLFPYTTLFRSIPTLEEVLQVYLHTDHCLNVELKSDVIDYDGLEKKVLADRKSTRLNSSHVSSSYAVFCLKNKNILLCSIV